MDSIQRNKLLEALLESLELPDAAYEKAVDRYENLGAWFNRDESTLKDNSTHIFPQGSFRLGTAIKPINEAESYDLDLGCNIRAGFTRTTRSQRDLKATVGYEIEAYRRAYNVKAEKEEKHRCWRLEYADIVSFHLDIVPCIPISQNTHYDLTESIAKYVENHEVASNLSSFAVCITDNTLGQTYTTINDNWPISNTEGYAQWFISRMKPHSLVEAFSKRAQVDDVPVFKRKTPLQRVIQLLKRHRDVMFQEHSDSKPISAIITTIAANSYSGSTSLTDTLQETLIALSEFANSDRTYVLNPVNPDENFADKWLKEDYAHLRLKDNFQSWVREANRHFSLLLSANEANRIYETANDNFKVRRDVKDWAYLLALPPAPSIISAPKNIEHIEARPWSQE